MFQSLSIIDFRQRTGLDVDRFSPLDEPVASIVSLRTMVRIQAVVAMPFDYLARLIRSVPLVGNASARPYGNCKVSRHRHDARAMVVGQTFIENGKILNLFDFDGVFDGFDVPFGISKKGGMLIFGRDAEGLPCAAQYLPPIIEWTDGKHRLLDGMHRCAFIMRGGTTVEVVKIHHVKTPFPCELKKWRDVRRVEEKPPKAERFFGLNEKLFRDLKAVGIDG